MEQKQLEDLRKDYHSRKLDKTMVKANPIDQFKDWFAEAIESMGSREPNAMTLATASKTGVPSARIVLLKGVSEQGFVFYTNYHSRKGQEMEENPTAALVFFWPKLERQIRIVGHLEKLSAEASATYFQSRPKKSQIGAHASSQSRVIKDRSVLEDAVKELETTYKDAAVLPKPENWGGYRVQPHQIEFWQGRASRLHDRILYTLENDNWKLERLAP